MITQLGSRILANSSGASRLGVVSSLVLVLVDTLFVLRPFERHNRDIEDFVIFLVPIIAFWAALWVIKGFIKDSTNNH